MKTATVTWITYNNYGTLLQAYALQSYIVSMNVENKILFDGPFVTNGNSKSINCCKNNHKNNQFERIKKCFFHPKKLLQICKIKWRKRINFKYFLNSSKMSNDFRAEYIDIDYNAFDGEKLNISNEYDTFICGSDQIWSSILNLDDFYFLSFTKKKKVAYAPSMSSNYWSDTFKNKIKEKLQSFDYLSTREKSTSKQLAALLNRDVKYVCDPTLLLPLSKWVELCSKIKPRNNKFILCYFLENNNEYFRYAELLSKKMGLKLALIPSHPGFSISKHCLKEAVGPIEFVSLFRDASYVVTDSYHGTIFSLIFQKRATILKRFQDKDTNNQNIRIISLLQTLGYEKVFLDDMITIDSANNTETLDGFIKESQDYLKRSLGVI